jgi:hypothetical protein
MSERDGRLHLALFASRSQAGIYGRAPAAFAAPCACSRLVVEFAYNQNHNSIQLPVNRESQIRTCVGKNEASSSPHDQVEPDRRDRDRDRVNKQLGRSGDLMVMITLTVQIGCTSCICLIDIVRSSYNASALASQLR